MNYLGRSWETRLHAGARRSSSGKLFSQQGFNRTIYDELCMDERSSHAPAMLGIKYIVDPGMARGL